GTVEREQLGIQPTGRAGRRKGRQHAPLGQDAQDRKGFHRDHSGRQTPVRARYGEMTYEVYALKYAHHARRASENFIGGDPHDGPMPLDYFVWLVRGEGREIVVDTGFSAAMARKRGRQHLRCPTDALRLLEVDAAQIKDVVITHLHYDHVGNFELFPAATLHLQELEMRYATGRYMCSECFRGAFEAEDVAGVVRRLYDGRGRFPD